MTDRSERARRSSTIPLYAGGFLGPFGGGMLIALIPTVAAGLGTSVALVASAITAYMVPFAVLQLFSGTLAERIGRARTVRAGYVTFGAAALLCALAPEIWSFIGGRALMGASNAFLTPVLLAALSETVPPRMLGRSVGTFAAVQTAGITMAPLLGGVLGEFSWRLAFVLAAAASFVLAVFRLELRASGIGQETPRATLRVLVNPWIGLLSLKGFAGYLGFTGIGFVVALVASREFDLGSAGAGFVVALYGAGGIVLGRFAGATADRVGRPKTAIGGALACAAGVLGLGLAPGIWTLALLWFAVGCAATFVWAGLNTMAVENFPENRAGAVSVFSAFKFFGVAVAPLIYIPLLNVGLEAPFIVAMSFSLLVAVLVLPWFARYRGTPPPLATGHTT